MQSLLTIACIRNFIYQHKNIINSGQLMLFREESYDTQKYIKSRMFSNVMSSDTRITEGGFRKLGPSSSRLVVSSNGLC
jgi:hypothetical protein